MPHNTVKGRIRRLKARTLRMLLLRLYLFAIASGNHRLKSKIENVVGTSPSRRKSRRSKRRSKRRKGSRRRSSRKRGRSAKQRAATRKLVAFNKRRRRR